MKRTGLGPPLIARYVRRTIRCWFVRCRLGQLGYNACPMLVPNFLFGEAREVRANVGKAITRLKRGATLQDICESSGKMELGHYPESFIWIERAWVFRSSHERDYQAVLFNNRLVDPYRIPCEQG